MDQRRDKGVSCPMGWLTVNRAQRARELREGEKGADLRNVVAWRYLKKHHQVP